MKSVDRIVTGTVQYPDSGIWEIFACGIRNSSQGIRNPANDCKPKSKIHWQGIRSPIPESWIKNPRLSWIPLHVASQLRNKWEKRTW